jgi:hypothetical protein
VRQARPVLWAARGLKYRTANTKAEWGAAARGLDEQEPGHVTAVSGNRARCSLRAMRIYRSSTRTPPMFVPCFSPIYTC